MAAPDFSDSKPPTAPNSTPIRIPVVTKKMAPPPAFSDISKAANDLINKDFYHANASSLEVKLKAPDALSITAKGTSPHSGDSIAGSLEAKKVITKGLTVTETLLNNGNTTSKVELDELVAEGLKLEFLTNFSPKTGFNKGQKASLHFKNGPAHARVFGDYAPSTGNIQAAADGVFAYEGFLVGGEAGFDVQKAALTRYALAAGYSKGPFTGGVTATNNLSVFTAAFYQKVNDIVQTSGKAVYDTKNSSSIALEIAARYKVDDNSFAKAKINDRGILALAYNTKVNSGFTLGVGVSLDTQKLNEAGHKIGTSLTFEA